MYGWAWPHGWHSVGQAVGVAAQNCALMTGRLEYMDFPRSQIDALVSRGIERDDQLYVPHKYDDPGRVDYEPGVWMWYPIRKEDGTALQQDGWFEFMPMYPSDIAHLWCMSMDRSDSGRFERTRKRSGDPFDVSSWHHTKDQGGHDWGWMAYLHGGFPEYPERILQHNLDQVQARLDFMAQDEQDPATYNDAYFQQRNPVTCEGLVQLTMGAPLPHYNGGLLVTRLRHFDIQRRRPGLPPDVAALVSGLSGDRAGADRGEPEPDGAPGGADPGGGHGGARVHRGRGRRGGSGRSGERPDLRPGPAAAHPGPARAGHEALRPRAGLGPAVVKAGKRYSPAAHSS